ncbi:hypothetical protein GGR56DRAFT_676915 [Xylariaceae sp. FL0804]|nr:hypothetical protein GGR56DRAFT_676915 [Xylariaceae sp. FL0804]
MPSQIYAPVPVTPPRKSARPAPSSDLFASLNATLASKESKESMRANPIRSIQESDWDVPAPPPPSPVRH